MVTPTEFEHRFEFESQFLTQLDGLLKRKVLTEQEFAKDNESAKSQKEKLKKRKLELSNQLKKAIEKVPKVIKTFIEAFQNLEPC